MSMQLFALEKAVYELEEKFKIVLKDFEERFELQVEKIKKYEEFLKGFEGGVHLPEKIEEEHKRIIKRRKDKKNKEENK